MEVLIQNRDRFTSFKQLLVRKMRLVIAEEQMITVDMSYDLATTLLHGFNPGSRCSAGISYLGI
jgi:hypothetical protein